jgi:hypothetical protein
MEVEEVDGIDETEVQEKDPEEEEGLIGSFREEEGSQSILVTKSRGFFSGSFEPKMGFDSPSSSSLPVAA